MPTENSTVHVINIDIQDNHEEATIGAFLICEMVTHVCQFIQHIIRYRILKLQCGYGRANSQLYKSCVILNKVENKFPPF